MFQTENGWTTDLSEIYENWSWTYIYDSRTKNILLCCSVANEILSCAPLLHQPSETKVPRGKIYHDQLDKF